jgi:hypothetical protein
MKYKILSSLALVTLGITAIAPFASAVPRFVTSGVNNDVTGTGFTAGQKVELAYDAVSSVKDVTASKCGVLTINGLSSTSVVTVGGTPYNVATQQAMTKPPVVGAGEEGEGCSWNYSGKWLRDNGTTTLYVGGQTPYMRQSVTIAGPAIRKATANACGFIKLNNAGQWKDKAFTYSGTAVTPTSISVDPQCKNGVGLYPTNFPGVSFTP